jgi:hypothetical protein
MSVDSHRSTTYQYIFQPPLESPSYHSQSDVVDEGRAQPNQPRLQSDEAEYSLGPTATTDTTAATVAEFLDETPGTAWSIEHPSITNLVDRQPEVELAQYLSRPVLIKTHVWSQTDNFATTTTWNPWYLFFNSTPIKNKLNNYFLINCTLKLKFVINASPFYSGAMAFTYCPLQGWVGENIIADGAGGELMSYSQRPKVWIFPQTCEGGELTLPFFYHQNWLDITSLADMHNMGTITPCLYAPLVSATGITGTSVVINVYAWAENVKLHAPTTKLALQSSEFEYKPSQIASAVAAASGSLSRIPMIGPYMKATSIVSSGVAKIASSLGFTNVPNMDTVTSYKNTAFPQNSTCEVSVPADRSAVDPKNEVTIDPRTVGLDGQDELSLAYIAGRECWIGNAILSSTDAVDALTLVSRVAPSMMYQSSSNKPYQFTPMAYVASQFRFWRGDVIFRFKFICTRFHKGRVRITFDPVGNISTSVPDYTTVFNEVVDIGAEQDLEVRVPYAQALTFLQTSPNTGTYNLSGVSLSPDSYSNGLITMRVVNPLSGPVANTAIPVMVFVRAADNIEFAQPLSRYSQSPTASPYALQSAEMVYPVKPKQVIVGNKTTDGDPNMYNVHFGEAVKSFRPLIHRLAHQYTMQGDVSSTSTLSCITQYQNRQLKFGGFDSNGVFSAKKIIAPGTTANYNYVRMGVHQMVALLFIGQRGSINHSVLVEGLNANIPFNYQMKRFNGTIARSSYRVTDAITTTSASGFAHFYCRYTTDPGSGVALTDPHIQSGLVMNFPYYSNYNFQFVKPSTTTLGTDIDDSDNDNILTQILVSPVSADSSFRVNYWSAYGPDYNFFFFRNTPSLYLYSLPFDP